MASRKREASNFSSISQGDVPTGRKGKHHEIILKFLDDLETLSSERALRVPLAGLPDTKANIRAALSRATKQRNIVIETSSDDTFLYVWKTK